MLHGDRVECIRNWLKDRFYFLDAVFEVANVTDTRLPYYTKGYITCGGPVGGGHPELIFNTTSPTILTVEIGQNGQIFKYMLPAYKDTKVIMPPLSSDSKRIGINSTTLLTKMDGLKDIRFQKFESMSLPKFSQIDLSNVTTLSTTDPVEFETVFLRNENGIKTSEIRDINLYNALGTDSFAVTVKDYSKIKRIDIRNSCVTSISLPSAPLSDLQFSNSQIVGLTIDSQPYLDAFTTVPAFVAQILMVLVYREQWYIWLLVDVLATIMWFQAGNYCMAAQYIFWCANCVYGYVQWTRKVEVENSAKIVE
jgi:hypothetical protein